MYTPRTNIKDLKSQYLIYKKIKGTKYYYRGDGWAKCHTHPRNAKLFDNEELVRVTVVNLNATRKGYKFKYESADKHFINNWKIHVDAYANQVVIQNETRSFEDSIRYKWDTNRSLNISKEKLLSEIETQISRRKDEIKRLADVYERDIRNALEYKEKKYCRRNAKTESLDSG